MTGFIPRENLSKRRRKFLNASDVMLSDLYAARSLLADLISEDDVYLPIYRRIEAEITARESAGALPLILQAQEKTMALEAT